ncbi:hypothetical protein D3C75_621760 [compost metagenome]
MDESDIFINASNNWANSAISGYYDIQSTFTHELGHTLRVDHSPVYADTMYEAGIIGSIAQRDLTAADREAAQYSVSRWRNNLLRQVDTQELEHNPKSQRVVLSSGQLVQFDNNQLVNEADVIVKGTVLSQKVQKDFEGFPVTDTTIQVQTTYKGEPGETVNVRVNGGEMEDIILIPEEEEAPSFNIGEEVIVFLSANKGSRPDKNDFGYYVVGQSQGKFSLDHSLQSFHRNSNESQVFNFNDFQEEINRIEEYNRTNNVPRVFLPEGIESNI